MSKDEITIIDNNLIKSKIINIRDQPVILDRDVAEIYGVETKDLSKAIKNNPDKFPNGYIIEVNDKEKSDVVKNFHHLQTLKFSHATLKAFTERGLYMLATILKSKRATEMTIQIIDTFTELRDITRNLDDAGNAKTEQEMSGYLGNAVTKLTNLLINNLEADTTKVKTTLELNLGIARAKIETETIKDNTKK
jgi:phage regulator Rha-like protein